MLLPQQPEAKWIWWGGGQKARHLSLANVLENDQGRKD